jgi:NACalpha-BTF3-like transcription factor
VGTVTSVRWDRANVVFNNTRVTSTNSHNAITQYHEQATRTAEGFKHRVQEIQTTLSVMGSRIDQDTERILDKQSATLKEHLKLCEESINLVREQARYKSEFGNVKTGEAARSFLGVATKQLQGGVDQKFGDSDLGAQSVTFMGAGDTAAMLGFFEQANVQRVYAVGGDGQPRDLPRFEVILPQMQPASGNRRASAPQALPESTATPQFIVERVPSREEEDRRERIIDRGRHH